MSDLGDLAARLSQLSDTELVALVIEATAARPALRAVQTAAEAAVPTAVAAPVGSPQAFSVSDVHERRAAKVGQDRIDDIRDSLRKSIKRGD